MEAPRRSRILIDGIAIIWIAGRPPVDLSFRSSMRILGLAGVLCALGACAPSRTGLLELPADRDVRWFGAVPGAAAYAERRGSDAYLVAEGRREGPYP